MSNLKFSNSDPPKHGLLTRHVFEITNMEAAYDTQPQCPNLKCSYSTEELQPTTRLLSEDHDYAKAMARFIPFILPGSLQIPCLALYRAIPTSFYLAF